MPPVILRECERLSLDEQWIKTMEQLLSQFESFWRDSPLADKLTGDSPSTKDILDRPSFAFLGALRQLKAGDSDEMRKVLFSTAISRLPVFHVRVKSEGSPGPQFWNPLEEPLAIFIQRARSQHRRIRYYTSDALLHGEDVIQTTVFELLSAAEQIDGP